MILCDTNILIEVYKDNSDIIKVLKSIGQHNIAVSDVTCAELLYGARNKNELQIIQKDLKKLTVIPIETSISTMAIEMIAKYSLSHKLSLPDALIASASIIYNLDLFTLNLKDFRFLKNVTLFEFK